MPDLPDVPVVHLPWSHWEALTARLDALEAALASAQQTIAWRRAEIDRLMTNPTPPPGALDA